MQFILNNLGTIFVAAIVFGTAALIVAKYFKDKKTGKSSCACGCSNCPMSGKCRGQINEK